MRVVDRLERREQTWHELDMLLYRLDGKRPGGRRRRKTPDASWIDTEVLTSLESTTQPVRSLGAEEVIRLGELYRAACADLMLAEAYDLPRETVAYLHALVARAHNALYRAQGLRFRQWAGELFGEVPRRLRRDPLLRVAALLFWAPFLIVALLSAGRPDFAREIVGEAAIEQMEEMYAEPIGSGLASQRR